MDPLRAPDSFDFPFTPYNIQHDFMTNLYSALEHKKLGIFESPTGTGKSLSIICGAIRWLKDHNNRERESLRSKIDGLQSKKATIEANSGDWLTSQSQEIELTRQINELKLDQDKIVAYDKKIEQLKTRTEKEARKKWPKPPNKTEEPPELEEKTVEDDDIVLEDPKFEADDESDEEEDVNKYKPTKIYICSRTHSQLTQFIGEICKSPFAKDVRVASLASRQNYCINPDVTRLKNNSLINERCLDMQKKQNKRTASDGKVVKKRKNGDTCKCAYYKQGAIEELRDSALTEVQDVEDLVANAKQLKACPYYASRLAAEDAEVILVPYNTILHKATREANGISLADNVVIIDEAHNLMEAMAQMHNSELSHHQLQQSLQQLKCYKQRFNTRFSAANLLSINQLIFVATKLVQLLERTGETDSGVFTTENFVLTAQIDNYNMFKLVKFCKNSRLAQKVRSYAIKYPLDAQIVEKCPKKGLQDFLKSIESNKQEDSASKEVDTGPKVLNTGSPLLAVISFLESLTYAYNDGRIFLHSNVDKTKSKLQFLLLNPSKNFSDIVATARSVIVAGGTMRPISEFRDRLFVNSGADSERIVEFSCDHIIPSHNILPIIVTKGPKQQPLLFNYENRMSMGDSLKAVIRECCDKIPGGIVAFFPSYSYENWVWQQLKDLPIGRPLFREPQNSGCVEAVLKNYADAIAKPSSCGALLLSVVGGKLSEGLNFSDDLGRCVIVAGMPYANVKAPDLKEKMSFLDKNEGSGAGKRFYESLCMKAVNQSIGRAVRHQGDYATILLLDERYNRISTKNSLPDWIKRSLKVCDFQSTFGEVDKFFKERRK